jgi:hypothetical protein
MVSFGEIRALYFGVAAVYIGPVSGTISLRGLKRMREVSSII